MGEMQAGATSVDGASWSVWAIFTHLLGLNHCMGGGDMMLQLPSTLSTDFGPGVHKGQKVCVAFSVHFI